MIKRSARMKERMISNEVRIRRLETQIELSDKTHPKTITSNERKKLAIEYLKNANYVVTWEEINKKFKICVYTK